MIRSSKFVPDVQVDVGIRFGFIELNIAAEYPVFVNRIVQLHKQSGDMCVARVRDNLLPRLASDMGNYIGRVGAGNQ